METTRRQSKKRDAIRELLLACYDHPSAEEIYRRLKPDYPDLSLGTVYRNLALFREEGKAMSVATVAGQERLDGRTHPHAHFVCEKCARHRRNARRGKKLDADILRHLPLLCSGRSYREQQKIKILWRILL